ncbi:TPA: hypothetical protein ACG3Q9_003357 [Clostridioides difficile]
MNLRKTDLIDNKASEAFEFNEVHLTVKFKENVNTTTLMSLTDDSLTQKLISLEDKRHQPDIVIIKRTKMMLKDCFGSNMSKTNLLIQVVSKQKKVQIY